MSPLDFEVWLNHFEHHARSPRRIPHGISDVLRPLESGRIASSIATFQLGEQSEGRSLLRAAQRCARARALPALERIVLLLILEERNHAVLIRDFMEAHGIPIKRSDWTDQVFRRVRRLAGLEFHLNVLIAAELVGIVYYRALEKATDCQRLKVLCRGFVADELAHVGFESQLLHALRRDRPAPVRRLGRSAHRAFFAVTVSVVWLAHRRVLRPAGHGFRTFLQACLDEYSFYLRPVDGERRRSPVAGL